MKITVNFMDRHNHHVIIVSGFKTYGHKNKRIISAIENSGMIPHVFNYNPKEWKIDRAAMMLGVFTDTEVVENHSNIAVSFLGYEFGSLVMRYYLTHYKLLPARRCVIIAAPFHSSDKYRKKKIGWFGKYRYGNSLEQLAEGPQGFPTHCGIPPLPFGVVVTSTALPKKGGKINNQKIFNSIYTPRYVLKEAREIIYTPLSCKTLLKTKPAVEMAISFLEHGYFKNY